MNPGADCLPADVLKKIFSYLPCIDLVKSVQFVCTWWQQVSWDKELWKYVTYQPDSDYENVIQMLKLSPQLRCLNLISATIDYDLVQFITDSCPNLERLHIIWNSIYNNSRVTITRPLSQIKMLSLFQNTISSLNFPYLDSAFPNLESLSIFGLKFNKKDLEHYLQRKRNTLHTLSIPCCTADDFCVLPFLSLCTKLRNLCLYWVCDKVWSCKEVGYLSNISCLTVQCGDISNVNDSSPVFCSFPNITVLVLDCVKVSENLFSIIARNCPQLQKLKLFHCYQSSIYEEVLIRGTLHALHLERLTHLYIHGNRFLTDEGIKHILRVLPGLTYLDLYQCELLTTECLKFICGISKLEVLKFDLSYTQSFAEVKACDVKNKNFQLMCYGDEDSDLDTMRQQKLRVYLTSYSQCQKEDFSGMCLDFTLRSYPRFKHCCLCCR